MSTSYASREKDFCLQKLDSIINLLKKLNAGDYPHRDSGRALKSIIPVFEDRKRLLQSLGDAEAPDTVLEFCRRANIALVRFKDIIGLILRSGNIRNAFEIYFPIKVLALELVGKGTRVVLGSEWNFSPYTYPIALPELPEFIFVGIPASECQNPLIVPLAGHELGHVVWRRKGAKQEFDPVILKCILDQYRTNWPEFKKLFDPEVGLERLESDLFLLGIWKKSYQIAQRQLEEIFCDLLGINVFGRSFLSSFQYLVAPSLGHTRNPLYPKLTDRARYMREYASAFGIRDIAGFENSFGETDPKLSPNDEFILRIADGTTEKLYGRLPGLVEKYRNDAEPFTTGSGDEASIEACLKSLVPSGAVRSIAAIVNAGWSIRLTIDDWDILTHITDSEARRAEKLRVLQDLVLKSFEVYEYRKRTERAA